MMEPLYFTLLELLPIQHKLFKSQLLWYAESEADFTALTHYFSQLPLTLKDDAQILLGNVLDNFQAFSPLRSEKL